MKKLILLRLFLWFPLIGSLLPDAGIWFSNGPREVPALHLVIEAVLLVSIVICSIRIAVIKKRDSALAEDNERSAYEV